MATLHPDSIAIPYLVRPAIVEMYGQSPRKQLLVIGTPYHIPNKQHGDFDIPFNQIEYFQNFDKTYEHLLPEIRAGDIKVLFIMSDAWSTCNKHEEHLTWNGNFLTLDIYNLLYQKVTELGIKENSVFSSPSSTTDLDQHEDWPVIPYTEPFNRYFYFSSYVPFINKTGPIKNRYLWLNRRSREHRIYALHEGFRHDMMKDALYTFHNFNEWGATAEEFRGILLQYLQPEDIDMDFANHTMSAIDPQYKVETDTQDIPELVQLTTISERCQLELVSEFNCSNNKVTLTEKISRSIVMGNPFIVLGDAGTLAELRKMGFKTFDRWIDESYDTVLDVKSRMDSALRAAREFEGEYYDPDLQDVLEYNYNHYFGEYKRQQTSIIQDIFS